VCESRPLNRQPVSDGFRRLVRSLCRNDKVADVSKLTAIEETSQRHAQLAAEPIADATARVRELDHRRNDGIDVRLLWDARTNRVSLALTNEHSDEALVFEVDPGEALAAFHHPYAYARS
jgi:hypothetical protein